MRIGEANAHVSELGEIRRVDRCFSVEAFRTGVQVIDRDEEDVRFLRLAEGQGD